jgi:hypothetical protein
MRRIAYILAAILMAAGAVQALEIQATDDVTIGKLIPQLGSKTAAERDAAQSELVNIGVHALPALKAAAAGDDPEVRARAAAAILAIRARGIERAFTNCKETVVKELGKIPLRRENAILSPNGEHSAYKWNTDREHFMILDGKEGTRWESCFAARLWWSYSYIPLQYQALANDGTLFYFGSKDKKCHLVTANGGKETPVAVDFTGGDSPFCSPDGKHVAYLVKKDGGHHMNLDGKDGPVYAVVSGFGMFSPDSRTLAYRVTNDKKEMLWVVGDKTYGPYPYAGEGIFSPDGKRFAFAVKQDGQQRVVVDGRDMGPAYDGVGAIAFTPDSKSVVYAAWKGKEYLRNLSLLLDGKVVTAFKEFPQQQMVVSPDGRSVAHLVLNNEKCTWQVAVNGKPFAATYNADSVTFWSAPTGGGHHMILLPPSFSADGRHVYYRGFKGSHSITAPENKAFMVVDGFAWPEHDEVWLPDDYRNYAQALRYVVRDGDQLRLVEIPWPTGITWEDGVTEAK